MEPVQLKFRTKTKWVLDAFIFCVLLFTAYLSLPPNSFNLTPVVYVDSGISASTSTHEWIPPAPLIVDLDNDFGQEVILATAEPALILLKYSNNPSHIPISSSSSIATALPYGTPQASSKGVYLFSELPEAMSAPRRLDDPAPHSRGRIVSVRQVSLAAATKRRIVALGHGTVFDELSEEATKGWNAGSKDGEEEVQKQILIAVTDDGRVHCYDRDLKLLWSQDLSQASTDHNRKKPRREGKQSEVFLATDVAIMVDQSTNTVFISSRTHQTSSAASSDATVTTPPPAASTDAKADIAAAADAHLNVWALDANSGKIQWEHSENSESAAIPWEVFRKDILRLLAYSLSPEAFAQLPSTPSTHAHSNADTNTGTRTNTNSNSHGSALSAREGIRMAAGSGGWWMALMRVRKSSTTAASASVNAKVKNDDAWMSGISTAIAGKGVSRNTKSQESEEAFSPNVLCIRHQHGIDVLHLKSGIHITSLPLAPDAVHGPLWPGVIGSVSAAPLHPSLYTATGADLGSLSRNACRLLVTAGVPPVETVHTIDPCANAADWGLNGFSSLAQLAGGTAAPSGPSASASALDALRGAATPASAAMSGGEGSGKSADVTLSLPLLIPRERVMHARSQGYQKYDVVVATSTGHVMCYRDGMLIWNTESGFSFGKTHVSESLGTGTDTKHSADVIQEKNPHKSASAQHWGRHEYKPSLRVLDLGKDNALGIVVLFSEGLIILDFDGNVLSTTQFPEKAGSSMALGDINEDGIVDVLLLTEKGYMMLALEGDPLLSAVNTLLAIVIAVIAVVLGALWLRRKAQEEEEAEEETESDASGVKAYVRDEMEADEEVEKHD